MKLNVVSNHEMRFRKTTVYIVLLSDMDEKEEWYFTDEEEMANEVELALQVRNCSVKFIGTYVDRNYVFKNCNLDYEVEI